MYEWFDSYCMAKPGVTQNYKEEWGWMRYYVGGKLFAALCHNDNRIPYAITLRNEPEMGRILRGQYRAFAPGYYCNKELYSTIWFQLESVPERDCNQSAPPEYPPDDVVCDLVNRAYAIVYAKLTKKDKLLIGNNTKAT